MPGVLQLFELFFFLGLAITVAQKEGDCLRRAAKPKARRQLAEHLVGSLTSGAVTTYSCWTKHCDVLNTMLQPSIAGFFFVLPKHDLHIGRDN